MVVRTVERGVGAGAIGGLAYGAYVAFVATPLAAHAEAVAAEQGHDHGAHEHAGVGHDAASQGTAAAAGHEHAAVSELTTLIASVGSGVLWGVLLGAAFGLAFYLFEPALPGRGAVSALVLGGAGFLVTSGVPWLVLPPALEGVERTLAPGPQLAVYGALMVLGAIVAGTAIALYGRVRGRGRLLAVTVATLPLVAVAVGLPLATPTVVQPGAVPTDLLAGFRGVVALSQLGLWATVAASFAALPGATRGDANPAGRLCVQR